MPKASIAMIAQHATDLASLMVMIYHKFFFRPANYTLLD